MYKNYSFIFTFICFIAIPVEAQKTVTIYQDSWTDTVQWELHPRFVATEINYIGNIQEYPCLIQFGKDVVNSKYYFVLKIKNCPISWQPNGKVELTLGNEVKIYCKDRKLNRTLLNDSKIRYCQSLFYLTEQEMNELQLQGLTGLLLKLSEETTSNSYHLNDFEITFSSKTKQQTIREESNKALANYDKYKREAYRANKYDILVRIYDLKSKEGEALKQAESSLEAELESYMKAYDSGQVHEAQGKANR